ncbi:MAG: hypothetical protein IKU59_06740 [Bacteroidales bacterium]|nr:hypothetical protein [Bacteroidales bacterium]
MSKRLLLLLAGLLPLFAFAQSTEKVAPAPSFDYSRNSLTIISVIDDNCTYGYGQGAIEAFIDSVYYAEGRYDKFDFNRIPTEYISTSNTLENVNKALEEKGIGKQVLDYWVQFDGQYFNESLMEKRACYNATDADVLADKSNKVSQIAASGKALMNNSYVVVVGPTSSPTQKKNNKGETVYETKYAAHVYKVNFNDTVMTTVWENWLYDGMPEDEFKVQKSVYDNLKVELTHIESVNGSVTIKDKDASFYASFGEGISSFDGKIDAWKPVTSVYDKRPLQAKIGKKEGLKNSDRYRGYKVMEDAEGNIEYKPVGYARATKVYDNRTEATGESECSYFYQISGGKNFSEGMIMKEDKDAHVSISVSGAWNGFSYGTIGADYLFHTTRVAGIMQYVGLEIGFDMEKVNLLGDDYLNMYIPIAINYSVGFHPVRWVEIQPYVGIGADYFMPASEMKPDDSSFAKQLAYFAHGGLKVGVNVCYPVQVFAKVGYSYKFMEGDYYFSSERDRFGTFSIGGGVKVSF